jgi:hypothetical protein
VRRPKTRTGGIGGTGGGWTVVVGGGGVVFTVFVGGRVSRTVVAVVGGNGLVPREVVSGDELTIDVTVGGECAEAAAGRIVRAQTRPATPTGRNAMSRPARLTRTS